MERSRRTGTKVKPHASFAELKKLRESGKKRLEVYEIEKEDDLYEEVDEEGYKKVVRDRLNQDDFVVDDGGEGYVDNGEDVWDEERPYSEDEEDDHKLSSREKKRKREEEIEKKNKQEGDIHKYFNKSGPAPVKTKSTSTVQDTEFLNDVLGEFDTAAVPDGRSLKKKRREDPINKIRRLSPPRKGPKKINNTIPSSPPPQSAYDNNDEATEYMPPHIDEYDTPMSDAPIPPSSPTTGAAKRKHLEKAQDEEDDEEEFAIAEIKGNKNIRMEKVNISSSRPLKREPSPTPAINPHTENSGIDSAAWTAVSQSLNVMQSDPNKTEPGKSISKHVVEKDGSVKMFWMDYTEINGSLILFGKVLDKSTGKHVSAFLKVDGIMRNLFFLPRTHRTLDDKETNEEISIEDLQEEVANVMASKKIDNFKSKFSSRKYAFEIPEIPREAKYLKVLYPYTKPTLPKDIKGNTFYHVFGTNTALFEQFVLCRNIMGPCWLDIRGADFGVVRGSSWCKFEMQVSKPQQISTISTTDFSDAPPLTIMSLALRTMHDIKKNKQEIIAISARIYQKVSLSDATTQFERMPHEVFTVVRPAHGAFPAGFEKMRERQSGNMILKKTENDLLTEFLQKLEKADPDVLVGHQLENVDFPVLLNRLKEKKTQQWSRIGRMKRTNWSNSTGRFAGSFFADRQMVSGRLMCDLANDLGKSLMTQCQSWSLTEMCSLILGSKRDELDNEDALKTWAVSGKGYMDYILHCELDSHYISAIALKIQMLPLTKQLTNLAGNSWARTLAGTRAERNEYILLHEFSRNKYICPDKEYGKSMESSQEREENEDGTLKKKEKFKGGLVFEPEKGLYDKHIVVMDFNSLYPSIIQEYNICFTTVERGGKGNEIPRVPDEQELGILPKLISSLVQKRRQVKNLMKDKNASAVQKAQWDIRQQALKLTANSMYGCLGYIRSRFYARPLAELTTFQGREILQSTRDLAESMFLQVIYGDTDSVMINTQADNYAEAIKIGNQFKKEVNNRYRLLEIDIDNVFQRLLLHAKKKYAALNCIMINGKLETRMEVKGLDMRRREYCQLAKEASSHILKEVFSGEEKEVVVEKIHEYLREFSTQIREGKFPAMKFAIFTKLGKNPEEYPNGKTMPQIQVALRKKARGDPVKVGDVISFIITGGGAQTEQHAAERAQPTQDVLKPGSGLYPDPEWYLIKQIFPPIERLCGPIDGTDSLRLAECLGLDTRKYQIVSSATAQADREIHPLESKIPDEERFKNAAKLSLRCKSCKETLQFEGLSVSMGCCTSQGIVCSNSNCKKILPIVSIVAQVEHQLRAFVAKYYDAWLVCDDSSCANRTRQMSVYGKRCLGPRGLAKGCKGVMHYEYTDKMLYNQLLYFQSVFNAEKAQKNAKSQEREMIFALASHNKARFEIVSQCVAKYLEKCGRQWVGMDSLFAFGLGP
ncbi:hypothetical protein EDC01DRAFT_664616 [Geopyxis carbonaria]|nr:hypothetical protein EDC01DRAFT_664616 [Geopyxis carbonaria]